MAESGVIPVLMVDTETNGVQERVGKGIGFKEDKEMGYDNVKTFLEKEKQPEKYNFEMECDQFKKDYEEKDPIERYLAYRSTYIGEKIFDLNDELYEKAAQFSLDNYRKYKDLADCEKCELALDLYKTLWKWVLDDKRTNKSKFGTIKGFGSFGGDTMNSVQTTMNCYMDDILKGNPKYNEYLKKFLKKKPEYAKPSIRACLELYRVFEKDFLQKLDKFKDLINLYHTLGNFVLVPVNFNGYRGTNSYFSDYWDLSLDNLAYGTWLSCEEAYKDKMVCWKNPSFAIYINTFFLWDYVDESYEVKPLFPSHSVKLGYRVPLSADKVLPETVDDFEQFLRHMNRYIQRRGAFMTAMLRIAALADKKPYEYQGKYEKAWKDWTVSGIYKELMENVFFTDKLYSGYEAVIKEIRYVIKDYSGKDSVEKILGEFPYLQGSAALPVAD